MITTIHARHDNEEINRIQNWIIIFLDDEDTTLLAIATSKSKRIVWVERVRDGESLESFNDLLGQKYEVKGRGETGCSVISKEHF